MWSSEMLTEQFLFTASADGLASMFLCAVKLGFLSLSDKKLFL